MHLRTYESSDCEALARLFHETVHTVNAADYTQKQLNAWAPDEVDLQAWDRSLSEHRTIVAVEGDKIVGFGDMNASGYLDRLFVSKDHQRKGIASAICDELERGAKGTAITTRASITALPFFERRGYVVMAERQIERGGIPLTCFDMIKRMDIEPNTHQGQARNGRSTMERSEEELLEARRQIASTLHKLEETLATLRAKPNANRLKPQITLASRRINAFTIALELIDEKLEGLSPNG